MLKKIMCMGVFLIMLITMIACEPSLKNEPQKKGDFYSLQEAYDLELLTQDDLKNIAYYHHGEISEYENFVAIPKTPEALSQETISAIKETRAYDFRNRELHPVKDAKIDDITIYKYYGTYNECVALIIRDYSLYLDAIREDSIAEVLFRYNNYNSIIIWKQS